MKIYGYQLSQATMRLRIALNIKGIGFSEEFIDLIEGEQFAAGFRSINPQQVVPVAILQDGTDLFQSMAILEYLEEVHPEPPLLPFDPIARAQVRGLAQIIIADTHRAQVPSTRNYITDTLGHGQEELTRWIHHWVGKGLTAFEARLQAGGTSGAFCHGDAPSFADLCLFPQILGARRFGVPLEPFPTAMTIFEHCMQRDAFARAIP